MQDDPEELFQLVSQRAKAIAQVPERDREAALASLHGHHERAGIDAGMSRAAALETANRLDTWIREVLRLRPDTHPAEPTQH